MNAKTFFFIIILSSLFFSCYSPDSKKMYPMKVEVNKSLLSAIDSFIIKYNYNNYYNVYIDKIMPDSVLIILNTDDDLLTNAEDSFTSSTPILQFYRIDIPINIYSGAERYIRSNIKTEKYKSNNVDYDEANWEIGIGPNVGSIIRQYYSIYRMDSEEHFTEPYPFLHLVGPRHKLIAIPSSKDKELLSFSINPQYELKDNIKCVVDSFIDQYPKLNELEMHINKRTPHDLLTTLAGSDKIITNAATPIQIYYRNKHIRVYSGLEAWFAPEKSSLVDSGVITSENKNMKVWSIEDSFDRLSIKNLVNNEDFRSFPFNMDFQPKWFRD